MAESTPIQTYRHWSYTTKAGVVWLCFDQKDSRINTLNSETVSELASLLSHCERLPGLQGLVIYSGKATGFIAGADILEWQKVKTPEEGAHFLQKGQAVLEQLAYFPVTTLAWISGFCLGGGLELALACRYRLAEDLPRTKIGFPEVQLGIHPGWGGTVRLPALIGPVKALPLILKGHWLTAKEAKKQGIVQEALPQRVMQQAVESYLKRTPSPVSWREKTLRQIWSFSFPRFVLARCLQYPLRQKVDPQHYPAPFRVIDNWVDYGMKPTAMEAEARSAGALLTSPTSHNLVRVFYLRERLKRLGRGVPFRPRHVHVVGGGVMGGGIAAWCALSGLQVTLQDQSHSQIGQAMKQVERLQHKRQDSTIADRLFPDPEGVGIAKADIIIEAITEDQEAKQALFAFLETKAKPEALLATNTSTIPLEEIASALKAPHRLIGVHFFNPVAHMPLVEVVRGKDTADLLVEQALAFVRSIDKLPLVVKSAPGFLVNRILMPYLGEAFILLEEGVPVEVIDHAATQFGMPMGPLALADTIGLDVCRAAFKKLGIEVPPRLETQVAKKELGCKTGRGIYTYRKGKPLRVQEAVVGGIPSDLTNRLILRMLNEAVACFRSGLVAEKDDVDAGCLFGFGFPAFRGGPLHYVTEQGAVLELLDTFSSRYGTRFKADLGWQKDWSYE